MSLTDIPALPFCHLKLKASRPLPAAYPKSMKTLGDHLRKRQLDLKLPQKKVAQRIGVSTASIQNWETGHTTPSLTVMQRLIAFLGYIPFEMPAKNTGDRIKGYRRVLGLRRNDLAQQLKIDPSTLARWEKGKGNPSKELLEKVSGFLTSSSRAALKAKGQPIGQN
jgi:transcriptional regulator with XRE-family HTH domain